MGDFRHDPRQAKQAHGLGQIARALFGINSRIHELPPNLSWNRLEHLLQPCGRNFV